MLDKLAKRILIPIKDGHIFGYLYHKAQGILNLALTEGARAGKVVVSQVHCILSPLSAFSP